jgi:hypothetical protein
MTAQVMDTVAYGGCTYALCGVNGSGLFEPQLHGLEPVMLNTACWRGYHCGYAVAGGRLTLSRLNIGLEEHAGGSLAGRAARRYTLPVEELVDGKRVSTSYDPGDWLIDALELPVAFTGSMLLGDELIDDRYVHMGFQRPFAFRVVHELFFANGTLERDQDRTAKMAELRRRLAAESSEREPTREEVEAWIEACFDLRY